MQTSLSLVSVQNASEALVPSQVVFWGVKHSTMRIVTFPPFTPSEIATKIQTAFWSFARWTDLGEGNSNKMLESKFWIASPGTDWQNVCLV